MCNGIREQENLLCQKCFGVLETKTRIQNGNLLRELLEEGRGGMKTTYIDIISPKQHLFTH